MAQAAVNSNEKSKPKEAGQTQTGPEQVSTESSGESSGLEIGAGAKLPSIQRTLNTLQNAPTEKSRQAIFRSLQRQYGNGYAAQVAGQFSAARHAANAGPTFAADGGGEIAAPENTEAVARVIQREPVVCPPPPLEKPSIPAQQDAGFNSVKNKTKQVAGQEKQHPPAKSKAEEAQAAAAGPANEVASQAAAAQVDTMSQQKPGTFDKEAFVQAVKKAVEDQAPKNLDEADKFKDSGKAGAIKGQVSGIVTKNKDGSQRDIKQATQAAPDTSKATPKPVTPMKPEESGPPPGPIAVENAVPKPKSPEETNLAGNACETDSKMKDAHVTEEQLKKSNEPEFNKALETKNQAADHAKAAPQQFKAEEQKVLGQAKTEASATAGKGLNQMHAAKGGKLNQLSGDKDQAKAKDEQKRKEISDKLEGFYKESKTKVDEILKGLDKKVDTTFEEGERTARQAMENYIKVETDKYKDKHYSGPSGWAQWTIDLFSSPPELNRIVDRGRNTYITEMDKVIRQVADVVGGELQRAKDTIAQGRAKIKAEVDKLGPDLKKFGNEAAQNIQGKFDQLEQEVNDKQSELVDTLASKYNESLSAVDDRLKEMKEANKGLWDKAKDAVGGVVETILKLKDMLLGVLAKAAGVIDTIISDPIKFLGNLVNAVKQGLNQFVGNIMTHLKKGLMGWLFGQLAETGIELPKTFDLKGILQLVLSIMGLTYANIRARAVGLMGEALVSKMEGAVEVFKILVSEGPAGLFKFIMDKLGELKEAAMQKIKDFIAEKVIMAGVQWLIGLLNPAGAFIKAAQAIISIVSFFIERGQQIMEFVNSILDSVSDIAAGALGNAAAKVEQTLGRVIPLAISFLANLLGLGGIAQKVQKIIGAIQKPVNKLIDGVIKGAMKVGKKLFGKTIGKVKKGVAYVKDKAKQGVAYVKGKATALKDKVTGKSRSDEQKTQDLTQGTAAAVAAVNKYGGKRVGEKILKPLIAPIKLRYRLSQLVPVKQGDKWAVHSEIRRIVTATNALATSASLYPNGDDPSTRTITQLWKDCSAKTSLIGESPADKPERIKLAKETLKKKIGSAHAARVDAILKENEGQSPRAFSSVVAEDGLGLGGHTTDRHVFGMGTVSNVEKLAIRVCRHKPAFCPGKAGAFSSLGDANTSVANAINKELKSNWEDIRQKIALGQKVDLFGSLTSKGTALVGSKVNAVDMPTYIPLGTANRPLYPGDPKMPNPSNPTPLTNYEDCTKVYIRIVANPSAPGGWYVNSAWPE